MYAKVDRVWQYSLITIAFFLVLGLLATTIPGCNNAQSGSLDTQSPVAEVKGGSLEGELVLRIGDRLETIKLSMEDNTQQDLGDVKIVSWKVGGKILLEVNGLPQSAGINSMNKGDNHCLTGAMEIVTGSSKIGVSAGLLDCKFGPEVTVKPYFPTRRQIPEVAPVPGESSPSSTGVSD